MKTLTNARFSEKDLIGLDRLYVAIEETYQDECVVKAVYEQKLFVLSACRDLASAQRKLDFEIALAESECDLLSYVIDDSSYPMSVLDELDEILFYDEILLKWRGSLQNDMRYGPETMKNE